MFRFQHWRAAMLLGPLCCACREDVLVGENFGGSAGIVVPAAGSGGAAGAGGDGFPLEPLGGDAGPTGNVPPPGPCVPVSCGGTARQCGNCIDDDQDGRIDAQDPDCLGPCDDSEAELFSGISVRVNGSCRSDCYFDLNSGSGDDGCNWSFRCDPLATAPLYSPTGLAMCEYDPSLAVCQMDTARARACEGGCLPLTPNGCDCFGCCELPAQSGNFIWLGSENQQHHCELESSADPTQCRPCTPVPSCQNDCKECELCVGKPTLPASCGSAARPACADGVQSCDPSDPGACGALHYCITGCCVALPR
ncbi:MAG TPA: hypothetical protein VFS67_07240 [Polyangiaceae bacterium]|nr:hypothetical protein [Polyangiaceae bacterium]